MKTSVWLAALAVLVAGGANAEMSPAQGQRPFDLVTGIVFTCSGATGHGWTGKACGDLSAEFKKRAEANKLPFVEVLITADYNTKKRDTVNGFNEDKAVRVFWNFVANSQGGVNARLNSSRIWEPTAQDAAGAVPGQRIPLRFYSQQVILEKGATGKQAEPYLKTMTDSFFAVGEKKL